MIEFKTIAIQRKLQRIAKEYPRLIEYEAEFEIIVNGEIFFYEPNFPIFEFLHAVNEWKKQGVGSFEYVSIETEDNPLISFICEEDMWIICSPWQLFECKTKFTREQLVIALNVLEKTISG